MTQALLLTSGQVRELLGVGKRVLRKWEEGGVLRPRSVLGWKRYARADVERLSRESQISDLGSQTVKTRKGKKA